MKVTIIINNQSYTASLTHPVDLSLPSSAKGGFTAWYVDPIAIQPVKGEGFIGSVAQGGAVNFYDMTINPHGNTTHTECVGHISKEKQEVNTVVKKFHFTSQVITITPKKLTKDFSKWKRKGDLVFDKHAIEKVLISGIEAVILRTQKDYDGLFDKQYNNTNWPYLLPEVTSLFRNAGVKHLLIDQPSVDREEDGGELLAHKAFWDYPESTDLVRTITEFIAVPQTIDDGPFLLNLSFANFCNDASPSRPVVYRLEKTK
jgi:arylformamidase